MASATINTMVDTTNVPLLVVYPHGSPKAPEGIVTTPAEDDARLKIELLLIQKWHIAFTNNEADVRGKSVAGRPHLTDIRTILITSDFHFSTYGSPNEGLHVTGRISTAAGWNLTPRENNACIHIYTTDDLVTGEYNGYKIVSTKNNKMASPIIVDMIKAALANDRGTLGEGSLA